MYCTMKYIKLTINRYNLGEREKYNFFSNENEGINCNVYRRMGEQCGQTTPNNSERISAYEL